MRLILFYCSLKIFLDPYMHIIIFQLNTLNESGLSPLMLACINNDEQTVRYLLEFGCDIDLETPPPGSQVNLIFSCLRNTCWDPLSYHSL